MGWYFVGCAFHVAHLLFVSSHWRLDHQGAGFGHCFWCNIVVDAPSPPMDEALTEENGPHDLISFDSSEAPVPGAAEENSCQLERQLSLESFEAITGPYTGGELV